MCNFSFFIGVDVSAYYHQSVPPIIIESVPLKRAMILGSKIVII